MLLLTGDIGGTKTILRLVEADPQEKSFKTIREKKYVSASFSDLVPMVKQFLDAGNQENPESACFAIAGPVINNMSRLTNLSWDLDGHRLEQELNINKVRLINDFAAKSPKLTKTAPLEKFLHQNAEPNPLPSVDGGVVGWSWSEDSCRYWFLFPGKHLLVLAMLWVLILAIGYYLGFLP